MGNTGFISILRLEKTSTDENDIESRNCITNCNVEIDSKNALCSGILYF